MEVLYESCCGIDVHKSSVAVCILLEQKHRPQKHLRRLAVLRETCVSWPSGSEALVSGMLLWSRPAYIGGLSGTCSKSIFTWCLRTLNTSKRSLAARPT